MNVPYISSLMLYLLPSYILFYYGIVTYTHNKTNRINRLGSAFILCFSFLFLALFVAALSPERTASFLYRGIILPFIWLAAGIGLHFFLSICRADRRVPKKVRPFLYYGPFAAVLPLSLATDIFVIKVEKYGEAIVTVYGPDYPYYLLALFCYTNISSVVLLNAVRKAQGERRKTYVILLVCCVAVLGAGFAIEIMSELFPKHLGGLVLAFHPFLAWAFTLHFITARYEFLPYQTQKYELLYKMSPFGIVLLDEQANVIEMNPAAARMKLGSSSEAGSFLSRHLPARNQEMVLPGADRPVILRVESDEIAAADAKYTYMILRDVTEEVDAIKRMEESENQYQQIAERLEIVSKTTNDGVWDLDMKNLYMFCIGRLFSLIGMNGDPIHLYELAAMIHPDDLSRVRSETKRQIREKLPISGEFQVVRPNGETFWVSIAGKSLFDENGTPTRLIGSIKDITERKKAESTIRHLAYHDALTGLPNRMLFHEKLTEALHSAKNKGSLVAVMLLDMDRFKIINDSMGHQVGDELLKFVGAQLSRQVRSADTVARLGGDEFVIAMPDLKSEEEAIEAARAIVERFNSNPFIYKEMDWHITCSLGISLYPRDGEEGETLVKAADISMYRAKEQGRNQLELFHASMSEEAEERHLLEKDLRKALEREELTIHYQPQIEAETGRMAGVEALLRWNSPSRGGVPPAEFIPIAEENGLIVPIGYWVLRQTCGHMRKWRDEGLPPITVAVNISPLQFEQGNFVHHVRSILEHYDIDPRQLCIEITESITIRNVEACASKLMQLNMLGVQIAIDDFGTGYSSLSSLQKLPISIIKIDKSFIDEIKTEPSPLVSSMIALAHSLQLTVLAEGVEEESQYHILKQQGCNFIQGYYFSRPIPFELLMRKAAGKDGEAAMR